MKLSLEELKRQNAEADAKSQAKQDEPVDATDELEELDEVEDEEAGELELEPEGEPEEDGDLEDGEKEGDDGEGELESWMSEDDNSHDGQGVPVKAHVKMKHKLKGKLEDVKDENFELRQRIAQLEQGRAPHSQQPAAQPQQANAPARPKRSDFENEYGVLDEDKYDAAVDDWSIKRFQSVQEQQFNESQQTQAQKAQLDKQNKAVDKHYERAAELVNAGKVKAETFQKADTNIRRRFESEAPGMGDKYTDGLLAQIDAIAGEKSALVAFKIGAKPDELEKVLAGYREGSASGMREIARIAAGIETPAKKRSRAVPPTKQIKGDKSATPTEAAFKKKVQAARKNGDTNKVIALKRDARKNGINTTNW